MMKTVTVTLQEILSAFADSMTNYILDIEDLVDMEDATETYLRDVRNIMNVKRGMAPSTLRRLTQEGFTIMMLPPTVFDQLEVAYAEQNEFCLVVKHEKETLCILCQSELNW